LTEKVHGGDSRLYTLFQPQPEMRRLFRVATAGLGTTGIGRALAMVTAALRGWAVNALLGLLPAALLVVLGFWAGGPAKWLCLVAGLLLGACGVVVAVVLALVRDLARMPEAGFGLCSGNTPPGARDPALVPWLHKTIQGLAGRSENEAPVTFRDLETAGIKLQLMTTNLSRRQPMTMPWSVDGYYYDPEHFGTLFPEALVVHMDRSTAHADEAGGVTQKDRQAAAARHQALPLRPFPAAADLPIVVAVRMSLSFPGLISAVPLHAVDFSLQANRDAREAQRDWLREHPNATIKEAAAATEPLHLQRNWFSDGGISANLPLHFFDSALPRRPTFAIDLAAFPSDREPSAEQRDNSYLPIGNSGGTLRRQSVWTPGGLGALKQFFSSIIDTARTWVDEGQLSVPGYRDRIVTVFHTHDEGGMNLQMEPGTVLDLSERGAGAAARLVERFAGEQPGVVPAPGWDNHRWVRFRTATAAFAETLESFRTGYEVTPPGTTPYAGWVGVDDDGTEAAGPLPSYPPTVKRRQAINVRTRHLVDMAREWHVQVPDAFVTGVPEPRPRLRLVPVDRSSGTTTGTAAPTAKPDAIAEPTDPP
jgi:predicted acylesterase/phospholipase RssA